MWHSFLYFLSVSVGIYEPSAPKLTVAEMAGRAAFGFIFLLLLIRIGRRRMMGHIGPFDLVVTMILGSTLSRGITGNTPLQPVLAACATIIAMHWLISALSAYSPTLSRWIQGKPIELLHDGHPLRSQMHRHVIAEQDLLEALRLEGNSTDLSSVRQAILERSGNISIIRNENGRK